MNIHSFDKKLHKGRLFGTLRRAVAGALTTAMLLPMVPTFGVGSQIKLQPIQDKNYRPDIEIQSNFVRDDFGFLTGYMELGLRVKTGEEPFRYLAVSLEYDTELYTPVDWTSTDNEIQIRNESPLPPSTAAKPYDYYSEELPAQKEEHINFVRAYTGIPDDPADDKEIDPTHKATLTPEVKNGRHALFSFWASATDRLTDDENDSVDGVVFKEMTTIAVIRFKVNEDEMENFTIKKNSDGTGYDIFYKEEKVTNVVKLQTEMNKPVANKWGKSVEFADDADIYVTEPDTELALEYRAGSVRLDADGNEDKVNGTLYERRYYYLPDYDASQNVKVNLVREGHTYANVDKPNYLNLLDPAVKVPSNVGDTDRFSYLTNLIVDKTGSADPKDDHYYVTFPVVSERSFMAGEDILDKLTTIVYVDWDNTLLGTQIVPQNTDVRGLVSDYVAENFIYHDADDTTYGINDLNNPLALTASNPSDLTPALDAVKSLERLYNYRGKYTADILSVDGTINDTTVDTDPVTANTPEGAKYPLTNKLDYVFFKRPMGHDAATEPDPTDTAKYPGGSTDPQYLADKATWENTWSQPFSYDSASNAYTIEYDVERPFAYGWAKCTQANFEDVWTTMGTTGELNSYTVDGNGVATVVYDGDYDFEFADLKTGFKTGEKTVFLKAVYEPGTELMVRNYRMVMSPQYNKLNGRSSADGGAYSVDVTYERANTEGSGGYVRGSRRMRSPAVRQQTTPDLRWETFEKDGTLVVDHDMLSATQEEASELLTKTTYSNVPVTNTEVVDIELVLSGRQNKVDYFLIETYGANFVAGSSRSSSNFARSNADFTVDNYNYYVKDESEAADPTGYYYNVTDYDTRDGSHGFVLYGTLNNLMQAATQYNNYLAGETVNAIDQDMFWDYTPFGVFNDANLRLDAGGTTANLGNFSQFQQKIQDAAAAAKTSHYGDPDYWDNRLDCARLTYHQLQWFILEGTLYSPAAADAKLWGQCHLHAACAATTSSKPNTWEKLMAAASGTQADQDTISQLTVNEVESYFHLRSDGVGTQYTSVSAFQADVVAAVATLTTGTGVAAASLTWDQVQYVMDKGTIDVNNDGTVDASDFTAANSAGASTYWWYDGKTKPTDFAGVLAAADYANTSGRRALVNTIEDAFNKMKNPTNEADRKDWIDLTENFATNGTDGTLDTSFGAFVTALRGAVAALGTSADWGDLQYHILHSSSPTHPADDAEIAGYFWHYGARKVTDVATMLAAAKAKNAAWDAFTFADTQDTTNYPELYFAKDMKGNGYASSDFSTFKTTIETLAAQSTDLNWNQVQYYLIHGNTTDSQINSEAAYYWWKAGGEGTEITFAAVNQNAPEKANVNANITKMVEAVIRAEVYGDPKALAGLTSAADIFSYLRIVKSMTNDPASSLTDLQNYSSVSDFSSDMLVLINAAKVAMGYVDSSSQADTYNRPALTWYQVQDYYLKGSQNYRTDAAIKADAAVDYWWYEKNSLLVDPAAQLIKDLEDTLNGTMTVVQLKGTLTVSKLNSTYQIRKTQAGGNWVNNPPAQNLNAAKTKIGNLEAALATSSYYDSTNQKLTFTWQQIQYWVLFGALTDADSAIQRLAWSSAHGGLGWAASGKIPSGVAVPPEPASLMMMRSFAMAQPQSTTTTTLSEDGLTETTVTTTKIWNQVTGYEDTTIVTRVVTRVPNGETTTVITTTTTVTTTIDEETGEPVTTSDTKTTVTEEFVTPETPLAPLPDDPYTITPDTDVIETDEPTEPPAESTVTPEETPEPGAGDKTESTGDADETTGETTSAPAPSDPVETDVPTGPEADPPENNVGVDDTGGPTTDPPGTTEPSADPPDPGGGEAKTLALARARLRLKPLSLISLRRTKAPPPLISIFTPNFSAGRALL